MLGGVNVFVAWRVQYLHRLAGPVFAPLGGPSVCAAWRASIYAAWRLCPRYLHHQQATAFAFLQEDLRAFFQFDFAAGRDGGFALYVVALR